MQSSKPKRYWVIQLWDGIEKLFEKKVIYGQITEAGMSELIRTLVAKHSLSNEEIIGCYAKSRTKIHHDLLPVSRLRGSKKYGFSCGDNLHAVAYVQNA